MTLKEVLDLMDHEVWVRVRINDGGEKNPADDLVLWSADWIGGGPTDPFIPKGLTDILEWDADDLSIEMRKDPERPGFTVPMLVVNAYRPVPSGPEEEHP